MKQSVVVAMLAVCALLATMNVHAQTYQQGAGIAISFGPINYIHSCLEPAAPSFTSIYVKETNQYDFYGDGGNKRPKLDLFIKLPAGFEFVINNPTAVWDVNTSADLTKARQGPTEIEFIDNTTVALRKLECKNTVQIDVLVLSNLLVRTTLPPSQISNYQFQAWVVNAVDYPNPFPAGFTKPVWNIGPTPTNVGQIPNFSTITVVPGPAEGIVFVTQPIAGTGVVGTYHDVQERIKKGIGADAWPAIQAVDCNGYSTSAGVATHPVVLSLLNPDGSDATTQLWEGPGPTYLGALPTLQNSTAWVSGKQILQFSVNGPGDYRIQASVPTIITSGNAAPGVSSIASSPVVFSVRQRPVTWYSDPTIPGSWNVMTDGYVMPIYGFAGPGSYPTALVKDLYGNLSTGDPITFDFQEGMTAMTPPSPLAQGRYVDTKSANAGYATFNSSPSITWQPSEANQNKNFAGYAFVSTTYFGHNNNQSTLYLDPRYTYPAGIPNSITPLPVELISFTALVRNQAVQLKWSTATETNNYGFDVERSFDGASWEKLGFVSGFGTTSSQRDYGYTNKLSDADMLQRTISYRLRQIDRDGTEEYSPVVTVALASAATNMTLLQNFPNPFNPSTNITFNLPESGAVTLTVFNELGVEVARIHDGAQLESGWHTASFNASALPSGVYMYRLQTGNGSTMRTMIVSK